MRSKNKVSIFLQGLLEPSTEVKKPVFSAADKIQVKTTEKKDSKVSTQADDLNSTHKVFKCCLLQKEPGNVGHVQCTAELPFLSSDLKRKCRIRSPSSLGLNLWKAARKNYSFFNFIFTFIFYIRIRERSEYKTFLWFTAHLPFFSFLKHSL